MPIKILYVPGTELIVLFDNNQEATLKSEFLKIVKSGRNTIEAISYSDFQKFVSEEFSCFTGNDFIACKSGKVFFPQDVCSLEEIKKVLIYFKKIYEEDKDLFDILKGNWRSFVK